MPRRPAKPPPKKKSVRSSNRRGLRASANNLKQLALAVHTHHDFTKQMPYYGHCPSRHSGVAVELARVVAQRFGEKDLYQEIRVDEPWDSEHNRKYWTKMPQVFRLPGKPNDGKTYYQLFYGERALYSRDGNPQPRQFDRNAFYLPGARFNLHNMPDGTSNTIFAVEARTAVNWMKPEDIPFRSNPRGTPLTLVGDHWGDGTFHASFCDGSVRRIRRTIPPHVLQDFITPDEGMFHDLGPWDAGTGP